MQYTTSDTFCALIRVLPRRIHVLAVLCFLVLALLGIGLEVSGGWLVWPPVIYVQRGGRRQRPAPCAPAPTDWAAACRYVQHTWLQPCVQGLVLHLLCLRHGHVGVAWGVLVPWLAWAWPLSGLLWPSLTRFPEWWVVHRLATHLRTTPLWLVIGVLLDQGMGQQGCLAIGLGTVGVRHDRERRCYTADLDGHFTLTMAADDPFRLRLFILALRCLDDGTPRGSRRTRSGQTPAVRQQMLAAALGVPQPDISRWEGYWQARDWRRLLSQYAPEILTHELQEQIIATWARHPQWSAEAVYRLLIGQGVGVTQSQVEQAAQESGWQIVRRELGRLCAERGETLRLRESWLVGDLLAQIDRLLGTVEAGQGLTREERLDVTAWSAAAAASGLAARAATPLRRRCGAAAALAAAGRADAVPPLG